MSREQRRLADLGRDTVLAFGQLSRDRAEFSGGMQWQTAKGREYLYRYRRDPVDGRQTSTSLGVRSPKTQAIHDRFMAERERLDTEIASLRPRLTEQARMAKALRLARAPTEVVDVLRAIGHSLLFEHVVVLGAAAVYSYEIEMKSLLPRDQLPDEGLDLLVAGVRVDDAVDELVGALRSSKIGTADGRRFGGDLRTDEGVLVRLVTQSMLEDLAEDYADRRGDGRAMRWALDLPHVQSVAIDRQGRAAPVQVPDPRAWCVFNCAAIDLGRTPAIGSPEASRELCGAIARLAQERWSEPFDDEAVASFEPLAEALGHEFLPPPRF